MILTEAMKSDKVSSGTDSVLGLRLNLAYFNDRKISISNVINVSKCINVVSFEMRNLFKVILLHLTNRF